MALRFDYTTASDQGLVRGNNEDSAYAGPNLLALADGMGGHAAGEVASQLMITHLEVLDADPGDNDMLALLGAAADDANASIAAAVTDHPEREGMGTTLTAIMFNGKHLAICHVGDSRGYRLRDGKLEQITVDDTYVQSLVESGQLDPQDVSTHPKRSLILKAYTGMPVEPGLWTLDAQPGDRLLLCSDGLSDPVTHETIESTLAGGTPEEAAQRLIALALRSGGPDNITVVIADVVEDSAPHRELPTKPATSGALLGEQESTHPDTAAGRAAALRRQPQVIPPAPTEEDVPDDSDEEDETGSKAWKWVGIISLLVVLIAAIGGGWWAYTAGQDRYYVDVDTQDRIVVERGFDFSAFGRDLHSTYQYACIGKDGSLRMVEGAEESCQYFSVKDVPPAVRGSITATPAGSYEDATAHLRTLADEALPICVTREKAGADSGSKDLSDPGVNCREVK
ncbi:protein phosphatase [Corynebacterium renale]|uniref:PP2C family protein-serine/threonine phosphatase n=1 Tax=Corynebacterium renale TaxID=1724 RepID=UPI000DA2715E|nr:protein phosphatase 2C domain-containing protein [Corynebacterium renale]SQG63688.1 protein phosphatase [Corynebacterium renale]STD01592.1 protein phosphatase [Corynebacterium renale]